MAVTASRRGAQRARWLPGRVAPPPARVPEMGGRPALRAPLGASIGGPTATGGASRAATQPPADIAPGGCSWWAVTDAARDEHVAPPLGGTVVNEHVGAVRLVDLEWRWIAHEPAHRRPRRTDQHPLAVLHVQSLLQRARSAAWCATRSLPSFVSSYGLSRSRGHVGEAGVLRQERELHDPVGPTGAWRR